MDDLVNFLKAIGIGDGGISQSDSLDLGSFPSGSCLGFAGQMFVCAYI